MISNEEKERINAISNDEERTRYIIELIKKTKNIEYAKCVDGINDTFYVMKIRSIIEKNLESDILSEFEQENNEYKNILEATNDMTEEEMCKYISKIKNKDIKILFFNRASSLANKRIILESIEPEIDDNLKEPVQLVQDMIKEYFQTNCGELFDEKAQLELEMIFKRTDVAIDPLLYPGIPAEFAVEMNKMFVSPIVSDYCDPHVLLLYLIHEYGHAIHSKNFRETAIFVDDTKLLEEGMCDTFADLVTYSYSKKHDNIMYNGKKVELEEKSIRYEEKTKQYDEANMLARCALYGLSRDNRDSEAVFEYFLGNHTRFFEMILGKEYVERLPQDFSQKEIYIDFSEDDIYEANKEGFLYDNRNTDNVYTIRNHLIYSLFGMAEKEKKEAGKIAKSFAKEKKVVAKKTQARERISELEETRDVKEKSGTEK